MKPLALVFPLLALQFAALCTPSIAAQTFVYPDSMSASFEGTDEGSAEQGYRKCEILITFVKAAPVIQGVDFRVRLISDGRTKMPGLAVDVLEFTVSNGIAIDPRRRPIYALSIASNIFETTPKMPQIDWSNGGVGIGLDASSFSIVVRLIERGDYLIGFFPKGTDDEIVYAVRRGIDAQVRSRFQDCVRRM
jgi:hypothetical protein